MNTEVDDIRSALAEKSQHPAQGHPWKYGHHWDSWSTQPDHFDQDSGETLAIRWLSCRLCYSYFQTDLDKQDWQTQKAPFPCRPVHLRRPDSESGSQAYCGYHNSHWRTSYARTRPRIETTIKGYDPYQEIPTEQLRGLGFPSHALDRVEEQEVFAVNCPDCLQAATARSKTETNR